MSQPLPPIRLRCTVCGRSFATLDPSPWCSPVCKSRDAAKRGKEPEQMELWGKR